MSEKIVHATQNWVQSIISNSGGSGGISTLNVSSPMIEGMTELNNADLTSGIYQLKVTGPDFIAGYLIVSGDVNGDYGMSRQYAFVGGGTEHNETLWCRQVIRDSETNNITFGDWNDINLGTALEIDLNNDYSNLPGLFEGLHHIKYMFIDSEDIYNNDIINEITEPGLYYLRGHGIYYFMFVTRPNMSDYITQYVILDSTGIKTRTLTTATNTWSDWSNIAGDEVIKYLGQINENELNGIYEPGLYSYSTTVDIAGTDKRMYPYEILIVDKYDDLYTFARQRKLINNSIRTCQQQLLDDGNSYQWLEWSNWSDEQIFTNIEESQTSTRLDSGLYIDEYKNIYIFKDDWKLKLMADDRGLVKSVWTGESYIDMPYLASNNVLSSFDGFASLDSEFKDVVSPEWVEQVLNTFNLPLLGNYCKVVENTDTYEFESLSINNRPFIDKDGNVILASPNGTQYKLLVQDDGTLTTTLA